MHKIHRDPGTSGLGFLWKISCGRAHAVRASNVLLRTPALVSLHSCLLCARRRVSLRAQKRFAQSCKFLRTGSCTLLASPERSCKLARSCKFLRIPARAHDCAFAPCPAHRCALLQTPAHSRRIPAQSAHPCASLLTPAHSRLFLHWPAYACTRPRAPPRSGARLTLLCARACRIAGITCTPTHHCCFLRSPSHCAVLRTAALLRTLARCSSLPRTPAHPRTLPRAPARARASPALGRAPAHFGRARLHTRANCAHFCA